VAKTTVEDVAAAAHVSRATVYRYFPDRDAVVLGVLLRDAQRFLRRLQAVIDAEPSFEQALIRGVLYTVDAVEADDNLARLFAPEASGITAAIAGASDALFALVTEFLRPLLQAARDDGVLRSGVDVEEAAEWILRTVLSLLAVTGPVRRGVSDKQRLLATFLVPALVERSTAGSAPAGHRRGGRPVASARDR
jgi:AcrR family transcriptional regulator